MAETIPLSELEGKAENLYEAIVIIAKRARQINELQKQLVDKEIEAEANESGNGNAESEKEDFVEHKYVKLPKPTRLALEEMFQGKLSREYIGQDEE